MDTLTADVLLREHLIHVWTVEAITDAEGTFPLSVVSAVLTFDEAWSPHVQLEADCVVPEDQDQLDALDPRAGAQIRVTAGYVYPDGTQDDGEPVTLHLHSRIVRRPDNTLSIRAFSGEMALQEDAYTGDTFPTLAGAAETLEDLITAVHPGATITSTIPALYRPDLLTGLEESKVGTSWWDLAADVQDRADVWVRDTGEGYWLITARPTVAGMSALALSVGTGGTITSSETELGREEWANAVLVRHTWTEDTGTETIEHLVTGYAAVTGAPLGVDVVGRKVLVVDRETPAPHDAVAAAAAALVSRTVSRGRRAQLEAHAAYWLRPGHTVTVQLPTGPQERHLVAAVAFSFPAGGMGVRTRVPENVTITGE